MVILDVMADRDTHQVQGRGEYIFELSVSGEHKVGTMGELKEWVANEVFKRASPGG